ncbi:MAG: carbohydrate ABC transporter permease [Anaerolineae bacterium]
MNSVDSSVPPGAMAVVTPAQRAARDRGRKSRRVLKQVLLLALVIPGAVLFLTPWAWMISTAGKASSEIWQMPPIWIPESYQFANFVKAWEMGDFAVYFRNTIFLAVVGLVGTTLSSAIVAYAFARLRFPGRGLLFGIILSTMMLPAQVTMIPLYMIFSKLGWVNSFRPLLVPLFFGDAFSIFLLRQFYMTISPEMDDAALIDGCSRFGVLFRILLPLVKPALAVVAIFTFTWTWNSFMGPLIYLNSPKFFPITLGLRRFMGHTRTDIQFLMAMTAASTVVPIVIFFTTQRYFIQGIVITGVKG